MYQVQTGGEVDNFSSPNYGDGMSELISNLLKWQEGLDIEGFVALSMAYAIQHQHEDILQLTLLSEESKNTVGLIEISSSQHNVGKGSACKYPTECKHMKYTTNTTL